jgi:hypothetical protein
MLVVLQTEKEEPVAGDNAGFVGDGTTGDGSGNGSGSGNGGWPWWAYLIIALLAVLCAALLAWLIWAICQGRKKEPEQAGPKKQIYVYRSTSQKERWEQIKKEEKKRERERESRASTATGTPKKLSRTGTPDLNRQSKRYSPSGTSGVSV